MIPISLSLKNFLCYRDDVPTLRLEGVHVVCLCGPNGHGKSALLDAVTWALWGEARGRRQDDLIYHGEREMQVSLEFAAQETHYKVMRRHARGTSRRQGQSSLELLVSSGNDFRPITGNTIAETQDNIVRLLNMDFHTFTNSAFLVQGRADEFTRATPAQRKEVLAKVLGLGLYDRLEARARTTTRGLETTTRSLEFETERLSQEVAAKAQYQQNLVQAQRDLSQVETTIQATARKVDETRRAAEEMRDRRRELEAAQERIQDYTRQLSELEGQVGNRRARLHEYNQKAEQAPRLQRELDRLRTELEVMERESEMLQPQRERFQESTAEVHSLQSDNDRLKAEMQDLRAKVNLLQREGENARCPLCNNPLEAAGCRHLASSYEAQGKEQATAYRDNEAAIHRLAKEARGLEVEVSRLENSFRQRRSQGQERAQTLEGELKVATTIQDLIPQDTDALATTELLLQSRKIESRETMERKATLEQELQGFPAVERRLQEQEQSHQELLKRRDSLLEGRSVLEDRINRCEEQEQVLKGKEGQLKSTRQEVSIYRELAEAFGKGGVQALIIEASVARLEEEANRLLGRMTNHRLTIKLETRRERRMQPDAEPVETLDILVADELGTRDYQMFSGGEAFRINFALRIALSKLLAERAGAPLPTLFVDEGFGTQDAAGRERILDVIRAIQDDFDRIVVITHMEEVKEAFPVRIEVSKSEWGSTFTMS